MTTCVRIFAAIALLAAAYAGLQASDALAAGTSTGSSNAAAEADKRNIERGKQAIEAGDWERAAAFLERAAEADARNADVFNLLAYSYRHLDRLDEAFEHYARALDLDPRHLGAHEYVGEAYLLVGDLAMAEHHLAALTEICASCEETEELAEAIERYRQGGE